MDKVINTVENLDMKPGLLNIWMMAVTSRGQWATKLTSGRHNLQDRVHKFQQTPPKVALFHIFRYVSCYNRKMHPLSSLCVLACWEKYFVNIALKPLCTWKNVSGSGSINMPGIFFLRRRIFSAPCSCNVSPHKLAFVIASSFPPACLFRFTFNSFLYSTFLCTLCLFPLPCCVSAS